MSFDIQRIYSKSKWFAGCWALSTLSAGRDQLPVIERLEVLDTFQLHMHNRDSSPDKFWSGYDPHSITDLGLPIFADFVVKRGPSTSAWEGLQIEWHNFAYTVRAFKPLHYLVLAIWPVFEQLSVRDNTGQIALLEYSGDPAKHQYPIFRENANEGVLTASIGLLGSKIRVTDTPSITEVEKLAENINPNVCFRYML